MAGPTFLIDGYNLLHALKETTELARQDLVAARERLVDVLASWRGRREVTVIVVFDGTGLAWGGGAAGRSVQVVFSRAPGRADEELVRLTARHPHPGSVTVVSSDRRVLAQVRGLGAATMRSQEFAAKLAMREGDTRGDRSDPKQNPHLSSSEMEEWERYFQEGRGNAQV